MILDSFFYYKPPPNLDIRKHLTCCWGQAWLLLTDTITNVVKSVCKWERTNKHSIGKILQPVTLTCVHNNMVNGLLFYSTFLPYWYSKCIYTVSHSPITHTKSHTDDRAARASWGSVSCPRNFHIWQEELGWDDCSSLWGTAAQKVLVSLIEAVIFSVSSKNKVFYVYQPVLNSVSACE